MLPPGTPRPHQAYCYRNVPICEPVTAAGPGPARCSAHRPGAVTRRARCAFRSRRNPGARYGHLRALQRRGSGPLRCRQSGTGTMQGAGGGVGTRACGRHGRRRSAGGWAGRMAELRVLHRHRGDTGGQQPARYDPLMHPVAVTGHAVIGDQLRMPSVSCEVAGCCSVFADHAALGEADNRARALAAGWAEDPFGRLACPACQQRYWLKPARTAPSAAATPAGQQATAQGAAGPEDALRSAIGPFAAQCRGALGRGWHQAAQWLAILFALASESNGWTTPPPAAVSSQTPQPGNAAATANSRRTLAGRGAGHRRSRGILAVPGSWQRGQRQ